MLAPITSITAALLGLIVFALALSTVITRVNTDHSFGDGNDPSLRLAIRAHGNLIEYAPIFLILMALLELQGASSTWLMALGGIFLTARMLYVAYFYASQALPLRILGFWGSGAPIALGSLLLLYGQIA